ncbi:hypothetical protein [Natronoglycomyces albus]|uniref:Uncharacterized protein n=1 Tax=Natronoglycomyces albus TaxID=2811108 RepID=A0A895XU09_9ACTN|nr:hypothetical protein [Natronoglycomyces albus]QSB06006.1 hypothetical protein JQS30_03520 [Natronoglycomyces albus]
MISAVLIVGIVIAAAIAGMITLLVTRSRHHSQRPAHESPPVPPTYPGSEIDPGTGVTFGPGANPGHGITPPPSGRNRRD